MQIDENTKLDPILTYFKKGQSHMAIITKVDYQENKDPQIKSVGIVTLEDIIEEIIEADHDDTKNKESKEQAVMIYN